MWNLDECISCSGVHAKDNALMVAHTHVCTDTQGSVPRCALPGLFAPKHMCVQARTCSSASVVCTARASAHTLGTARRTQAHTGCVEHARLAACSVHRMCVPWCARSEHFMRSTSYAKFIVTIRKICCNLPRYDLQLQRDPRDGYVP